MGKSKNAMSIRKIGKNDLQRYFELCNEENWGIGFARIEKMVLEGIFYCYEIGAQPVSFVGCYILNAKVAVLTSYVTQKSHRGKGYGRAIFDKVLSEVGNRSVILNSMENKIPMYGKSGFLNPIYSTIDIIMTKKKKPEITPSRRYKLQEFSKDPTYQLTENILNYDSTICSISRDLKWFCESSKLCLKALENEKIVGYCFVREAPTGLSFQPYYADSNEIAEQLLNEVFRKFPAAEKFQVYIPTLNVKGYQLMKKYFDFVEERPGNMWLSTNETFDFELKKVYSILDYCFSLV